jgi:hypothetical protein
MPWQETDPVDQRERFITDHRRGLYSMPELCARYGVSRQTGYKWLARYDAGGRPALRERSHAPHRCPHAVPDAVAELLCAARAAHPSWGARKLLDWLRPRHPRVAWPAASTAGDLLNRRGLVRPRRRQRAPVHPGVVPPTTGGPNDLWTLDLKGQFRTRDGVCCHPLTLADQHTRFLLACRGLGSTKGVDARRVLGWAFREYGLPRARDAASPRPYPARLPPPEYPGHYLVERVTNAGTFRFKDRLPFIANALKQHPVGLEETGDGVWSIDLGPVLLAKLDERDHVIRG